DGMVFAAPLVLSNVTIPGKGTHAHVVFVCTENDSVYAFDADSNTGVNAAPLWNTNFTNPAAGITAFPTADIAAGSTGPYTGITGTPVIDPATSTMFLVTKIKIANGGNPIYEQQLHALNIHTGMEQPGSPVLIRATVFGSGDGSAGGLLPFDALHELQRPGLLLNNGMVYAAFGSHADTSPYHGWLLGYNEYSLTRSTTVVSTPNAGLGGIWMAGAGPAADAYNNIYLETGNGLFDANTGGKDYGDTFMKINATSPAGRLADFFTPHDQAFMDAADVDLGSGGCIVLPDQVGSSLHTHLLVGGGKEGEIYLLDRSNLGHYHEGTDFQAVQEIPGAGTGGYWSSPAFLFTDPTGVSHINPFTHLPTPTGTLYYNGVGDVLKAYSIGGGQLSSTPIAQAASPIQYPGATPVLSASESAPGSTPANGIVWLIENSSTGAAVLHAYNAGTLAELYNSTMAAASRDAMDGYVTFSAPTVAYGKVFAGTVDSVTVFGLNGAG
ncbi:MAG TPA: hypothetical protein VGS41_03800, partial [Chthonomonadales bacterium]|nr:hypothetical protein [Chthonomonadales bacterium]